MERSETRDDMTEHVIVIDITTRDPCSTTNGTNARNTPWSFDMNSVYWISFEFVITMTQIIAAFVVLFLSKHEHPPVPLKTWVLCYVCGCVATLPLLFCRFYYRNTTMSVTVSIEVFQFVLDCFFSALIGYGCMLIFAGHSSVSSDAPNLYRLSTVFLACVWVRFAISICLQFTNSVLRFWKHKHGKNKGPHQNATQGGENEPLLSG